MACGHFFKLKLLINLLKDVKSHLKLLFCESLFNACKSDKGTQTYAQAHWDTLTRSGTTKSSRKKTSALVTILRCPLIYYHQLLSSPLTPLNGLHTLCGGQRGKTSDFGSKKTCRFHSQKSQIITQCVIRCVFTFAYVCVCVFLWWGSSPGACVHCCFCMANMSLVLMAALWAWRPICMPAEMIT